MSLAICPDFFAIVLPVELVAALPTEEVATCAAFLPSVPAFATSPTYGIADTALNPAFVRCSPRLSGSAIPLTTDIAALARSLIGVGSAIPTTSKPYCNLSKRLVFSFSFILFVLTRLRYRSILFIILSNIFPIVMMLCLD